jgi:hypothetical protein
MIGYGFAVETSNAHLFACAAGWPELGAPEDFSRSENTK